MRNQAVFWVSATLLAVLLLLAFITHNSTETGNAWLDFAAQNHTTIMLVLVIIAVAFGFLWSFMFYKQAEIGQKASKNVASVVLRFLSNEERLIISYLIEHSGKSPQAELAKLKNMGKVKAFRSVQRLAEKDIVNIEPRGKQRIITLNEEIKSAIRN